MKRSSEPVDGSQGVVPGKAIPHIAGQQESNERRSSFRQGHPDREVGPQSQGSQGRDGQAADEGEV
jgi:hypothetical protein